MEAITNGTPLVYELQLKSGKILRTIGDAAMYIYKLPDDQRNLFHWMTARANFDAADRHPGNADLLKTATRSMANALETDGLLKD